MREDLWFVFNRKLRSALWIAGIELGELKDEIVEGASQVVANFTDKDRHTCGGYGARGAVEIEIMGRIGIELREKEIFCFGPHPVYSGFQIHKVFICPPYSLERAIEYVRGHDTMR
jgi:hypothetical protein